MASSSVSNTLSIALWNLTSLAFTAHTPTVMLGL